MIKRLSDVIKKILPDWLLCCIQSPLMGRERKRHRGSSFSVVDWKVKFGSKQHDQNRLLLTAGLNGKRGR